MFADVFSKCHVYYIVHIIIAGNMFYGIRFQMDCKTRVGLN